MLQEPLTVCDFIVVSSLHQIFLLFIKILMTLLLKLLFEILPMTDCFIVTDFCEYIKNLFLKREIFVTTKVL